MGLYTLDSLLEELRQALGTGSPAALADVVRRAIREKPVGETGSTRLLHSEPGLTLLHTVVNPGFASPPHDHRTWAVIGVYHGQENNNFYRLVGNNRKIEKTGGRELREGEVLTLPINAIHRISNPRQEKLIALHVYGQNILEIERSSWDPASGEERPFKLNLNASD
jgi:predicted metal-dependent enzyme (double-stranded beta helix superfamily)